MTVLNSAEQISLEIQRRMQTITVADGFETDIGASVYLGRRNIDKNLLPCSVIIEGNDQAERQTQSGANYKITQNYVLIGCLKCDINNPNVAAHAAIRDLKRAIFGSADRMGVTFDGKVKQVEYVGREISPRADGEAFIFALIEVTVAYVENLASP